MSLESWLDSLKASFMVFRRVTGPALVGRARRVLAKHAFGRQRRLKLYRKMASLLAHNQNLRHILRRFRDREMGKKSLLAEVYGDIYARYYTESLPFDEACRPWLPPEETMLIGAGLKSGHLPGALLDLAALLEAQGKIRRGVVDAVSYPIFLLALLIGVFLFLALSFMPALTGVSDPRTWSGAAWALYEVSMLLASPAGAVFFAAVALAFVAAMATLPHWTGRFRLKVENLPPWSIYRLMNGCVWLFTLATLLKGGIQMENILSDMLADEGTSPWLAERVKAVKAAYREEGNLGQILVNIKMHFPDDEVVDDLAGYAMDAAFYDNLYGIAKEWLDGSVEAIKRAANVLNAAMVMGLGGAIVWMAVAIQSLLAQIVSGLGGF